MDDCISELSVAGSLDKYKIGSQILNRIMKNTKEFIKPKVVLRDVCAHADNLLNIAIDEVYRKKKLEHGKGIAFPTCISLNNIAGYFSPIDDVDIIKKNDLVKIEMAIHIDGFPVGSCISFVLEPDDTEETLKKVKLVELINKIANSVKVMMKEECVNFDIVKKVEDVAKENNYSLPYITEDIETVHAPSILSYQVSQNIYDELVEDDENEDNIHKFIMFKHHTKYDFAMLENTVDHNEVYMIDISYTTSDGKMTRSDHEPTVYKRDYNIKRKLKLKAANNIIGRFGQNRFPFGLRDIYDARTKMGINSCVKNGVLDAYPVFKVKAGEYIARSMFTIIVRRNSILLSNIE